MANLGSLAISLSADIARFEQGMNRAEYLAKKTGDRVVSSLKVIGVAAAGMFSLSSMDAAFSRITSMEAALLKTASRLNTTVETLSSLGVMARKTGLDTEAFNMSLQRMDKNISNAAKGLEQGTGKVDEFGEEIGKGGSALREMGLKAEVLNALPLDQKLLALATAMQKNVAPADQLRLALELGGKSAGGMVVALKQGPEEMQKWIERATELGIVTTDMAKRGDDAKKAAGDLSMAWESFARSLVDAVAPAITTVLNLLTDLIAHRQRIMAELAQPMMIAHGAEFDLQTVAPGTTKADPSTAYITALTTPSRSAGTKAGGAGGGGKGGGGSGDMGLDRMATIIDTLRKDLNKLTEGSLAEITAWATHMRNEIEKVGKKGAETAVASALVDKLEIEKKKKATDDYGLFVAKESGDTYAIIEAQGRADLEKYKGFATAKSVTDAATARKKLEEQAKNNEEVWGLQKNVFDSLASLTPIISEQNFFKTKSLNLEILIGNSIHENTLKELERKKVISAAQADEERGWKALENQVKRTNLAMEQDKGIKGWAAQRVKSESQTNTWADAMEGLESYVNDAWTQGVQGALSKTKVDFMEVAKTMAQSMVLNLVKQGIHKAFTGLAGVIMGGMAGQGKPTGTAANPFFVVDVGKGVKGGLSGINNVLGGDFQGLWDVFNFGGDIFDQGTQDMLNVFDFGSGALDEDVMGFGNMFTASSIGLAETSNSWGGMFGNAISGLMSAIGGGGGGGGIIGSIVGFVGGIFGFHEGGIITAHQGWAKDDVLIRAQTGERVLSRTQNRDYEAGMTVGGGRPGENGGGGSSINVGGITVHINNPPKDFDANKLAKKLVPALQRQIKLNRLRTGG